ncbi:MAG: SNF2-related protein [bacterium]|nr:SNF2-related protein [bacterium]
MSQYQEFLKSKVITTEARGIDAPSISPVLYDWQREIEKWALKQGKAALFEECGLGKTLQQVEWAKHVSAYTDGRVLLVAPLAVAGQTIREGCKLGAEIQYCRHQREVENNIVITNYDMLKEFDANAFSGVVLDESSILKAYTGQTKRMILEMFEHTPFKLACTATPAPNDYLELGNHAQFLNIMDSNEMISRWFINDTMAAGNYRLKGHAADDFWQWVTTWAVCVSKPSDIGYADDGFDLPPLNIHSEVVSVDHLRAQEQGRLFVLADTSATGMWKEKDATAYDRCLRAADIVSGSPDDAWTVWCDTNKEADILKAMLPQSVEVRGSESIAAKERKLTAFSDGSAQAIITKPDIAGYGLHWQHCNKQVFVGVGYSFEKLYQSLRRSWRFGQAHPVDAHLIYAETEGNIIETIQRKQEAHKRMQQAMNAAMRKSGFLAETDFRRAKLYQPETIMTMPEWLKAG